MSELVAGIGIVCCVILACLVFGVLATFIQVTYSAVLWLKQATKDSQENQRVIWQATEDIFDPAILLPNGSIPAWKRGGSRKRK